MTNMPSPTTVLDGPYRVVGRSASYSAVFSREPRRTRSKASYGGSPPRDQHFFIKIMGSTLAAVVAVVEASLFGSLKQAVPWKSRKAKN
ncbi:hypothetical protein Syun_019675 [Stephania yunnanensis]|uniref:Uncharacterized protein n=1 Tax=Stephania yunnanensis TaxID=152371 RepID=A0AAP0IW88_9MAGN